MTGTDGRIGLALGPGDAPWVVYTTPAGLFSRHWDLVTARWTSEPERLYCVSVDCSAPGAGCTATMCPSADAATGAVEQFGHSVDLAVDPTTGVLHACWVAGKRLRPPAENETNTGGATLWYSSRAPVTGGAWSAPEAVSRAVGYFECAIDVGLGTDEIPVPFIAATPFPAAGGYPEPGAVLFEQVAPGVWDEEHVGVDWVLPAIDVDVVADDDNLIVHLAYRDITNSTIFYASGRADLPGSTFFVEPIGANGTLPSLAVREFMDIPHVAYSDEKGVVWVASRSVAAGAPPPDPDAVWTFDLVAPPTGILDNPLLDPEVSESERNVAGLAAARGLYHGIPTSLVLEERPGAAAALRVAFTPHVRFDEGREAATPPLPGEIRLDGLYLGTRAESGGTWFVDLVDARVDGNGVPVVAWSSNGYARVAYHNAAVSAGEMHYWQEEDRRELVRDTGKDGFILPWPACEDDFGRLDGPLALTDDQVALRPNPVDFAAAGGSFSDYERALAESVLGSPAPEDGLRAYLDLSMEALPGVPLFYATLPACATSWDDLSGCTAAGVDLLAEGLDGTFAPDPDAVRCDPSAFRVVPFLFGGGIASDWTDDDNWRAGLAATCIVHVLDGLLDQLGSGGPAAIQPLLVVDDPLDALDPAGALADLTRGIVLAAGGRLSRADVLVCLPNTECPPGLFDVPGCPDSDTMNISGEFDRCAEFTVPPGADCPAGTGPLPCTSSPDCTPALVCDHTSAPPRCRRPVQACTGDADCSAGFHCLLADFGLDLLPHVCARARTECVSDDTCRSNETCMDGVCVHRACDADGDCPRNEGCDAATDTCFPLIEDLDAFVYEFPDSGTEEPICQKAGCFSCAAEGPEGTETPDYCGIGGHTCPPGHDCSLVALAPPCNLRPLFRDWRLDAIVALLEFGAGSSAGTVEILRQLDALRSFLYGTRVPGTVSGNTLVLQEHFDDVLVRLAAEPGLGVPAQGFLEIALRFAGDLDADIAGTAASCALIHADAPVWIRFRLAPSYAGPPAVPPTATIRWAVVDTAVVKDPLSGALHDSTELSSSCATRTGSGLTPPEVVEQLEGTVAAALAGSLGPAVTGILDLVLRNGVIGGWTLGRTEALKVIDAPRDAIDGDCEDELYDVLVAPGSGDVRYREVAACPM